MKADSTGIRGDRPDPRPAHVAGIQGEKPMAPWERPGCFRLDREPHRGGLLGWTSYGGLTLACTAFWAGVFYSLLEIEMAGRFCLVALPAVALSLATWHLAGRDLAEMARGLRDPDGYDLTREAKGLSLAALIVSACGCAFACWAVAGTLHLVPGLLH